MRWIWSFESFWSETRCVNSSSADPLNSFPGEVLQRALARGVFLHRREVAMHAAFLFVLHVALLLERAQDREHGGVGELVVRACPSPR